MKTLSSIIKTLTIFLFGGMLFFSCSVNDNDDYGTLVIKLPGGARAAVSPEFTNTLRYSVTCDGAGKVSREFRSGEPVSIPLNAGDWSITVTVLNAASEDIGHHTEPVVIEVGKTTTVPMSISIDTSGNKIKSFAITGFVNSVGGSEIEDDTGNGYGRIKVRVSVPYYEPIGNERIIINFTHTGKSAYPLSGTSLSSNEAESLFENGITVTAENGTSRTYTVEIEVVEEPPPGYTSGWPSSGVRDKYGIGSMEQPPGSNFYHFDAGSYAVGILMVMFTPTNDTLSFLINWFNSNGGWSGEGYDDEYGDEYSWENTTTGVGVGYTRTGSQAVLIVSSVGGNGDPDNPYADEYPAANFPALTGGSEFIGTWKSGEYYIMTLEDTGTWTLKMQIPTIIDETLTTGRFLVSGNTVYLYNYDDYDIVYYFDSWGTKTGNTLTMEGSIAYISGDSWIKQ